MCHLCYLLHKWHRRLLSHWSPLISVKFNGTNYLPWSRAFQFHMAPQWKFLHFDVGPPEEDYIAKLKFQVVWIWLCGPHLVFDLGQFVISTVKFHLEHAGVFCDKHTLINSLSLNVTSISFKFKNFTSQQRKISSIQGYYPKWEMGLTSSIATILFWSHYMVETTWCYLTGKFLCDIHPSVYPLDGRENFS